MNKLGARFSERLNRSLFFLLAVLVHLFVFLAVLGYVVWPAPKPQAPDVVFIGQKMASVPIPPHPPIDSTDRAPNAVSDDPVNPLHTIDTIAPGVSISPKDLLPIGPANSEEHEPRLSSPTLLPPDGSERINLPAAKEMVKGWTQSNGKMRFPIYLAKYADGDWNCNNYLHDGKLTSGALPNLFAKVAEWSQDGLASSGIKVVALDSREIIDHPPPFIFFTGHKDFHLTAAEIENLREYLLNGGAIWGDSAFAGDGSRFDVAFHREMKYVLSDKDLKFEPLPVDHDIFTKAKFQIEDLPRGMNNRGDPIECIKLDGKPAVIYTPNDYSDMMTMLLEPGRNEREAQMAPGDHWTAEQPLYTPGGFTYHATTYFRNYAPASAMASYKLSMNILVYLIHRYDDELLLTP
jgi:Domain of unknown function (DUF4159)